VEHGSLSAQVLPARDRDTGLLEQAVALYERGRLDEARQTALAALAREKNESLAHNLITEIDWARARHAEEVLLRGQQRPPAVVTRAHKHELAGRAKRA